MLNSQNEFKKAICVTKDEIKMYLTTMRSSVINKVNEYGRDYYRRDIVIKLPINNMYFTLGSMKRIMNSNNKIWYIMPLYGGDTRSVGDYHVQDEIIYKVYTRDQINSEIEVKVDSDDYPYMDDAQIITYILGGNNIRGGANQRSIDEMRQARLARFQPDTISSTLTSSSRDSSSRDSSREINRTTRRSLNEDVILDILMKSKPEDLKTLCALNREYLNVCKNNSSLIIKNILKKYNVKYTDPKCLIYLKIRWSTLGGYRMGSPMIDMNSTFMNRKYEWENINDYMGSDGTYNMKKIYKKYLEFYNAKGVLSLDGVDITNIPIMPNLRSLELSDNKFITTFSGNFESLTNLQCTNMILDQLGPLENLVSLTIFNSNIPKISGYPKLKTLQIHESPGITEVSDLTNLETLFIAYYPNPDSEDFNQTNERSTLTLRNIKAKDIVLFIWNNTKLNVENVTSTNMYIVKLGSTGEPSFFKRVPSRSSNSNGLLSLSEVSGSQQDKIYNFYSRMADINLRYGS